MGWDEDRGDGAAARGLPAARHGTGGRVRSPARGPGAVQRRAAPRHPSRRATDVGSRRGSGPTERPRRSPLASAALEIAVVVVLSMALSLLVKSFLAQAFFIPSGSMEATLERGDRVLVSKLTPGPFSLARGDVVVFTDPGGWLDGLPAQPSPGPVGGAVRGALTFVGLLPEDTGQHLIKRVIGLPGDHVACCDSAGRVTVNGSPITEPYLYPANAPSAQTFDVTVPAGRLWVMGDHRADSADSRYHLGLDHGTVPVADVVGRAVAVVWPLDRLATLSDYPSTFAQVPAPGEASSQAASR